MSSFVSQGAEVTQDLFGKKAFRIIDPIGRKALKAEKKKKVEASRQAALLESQRVENVKVIESDSKAQAKRRSIALAGSGRKSNILAGVQNRLKTRLGE